MIDRVLIYAVNIFANILIYSLVARAILSWFAQSSYYVAQLYGLICHFTEPLVAPFRRLLSRYNTGMFDFSVVLAFFAITIARSLIIRLIIIF